VACQLSPTASAPVPASRGLGRNAHHVLLPIADRNGAVFDELPQVCEVTQGRSLHARPRGAWLVPNEVTVTAMPNFIILTYVIENLGRQSFPHG
jgi:hypothetical protein